MKTKKTPFQHLIRDHGCEEVARSCGVSLPTVWRWSSGSRNPKPEMIRDKLGPLYGVDYADVYGPAKRPEEHSSGGV